MQATRPPSPSNRRRCPPPEEYERDQKKGRDLECVGFTALRFSDWEVLNNIDDVSIMIGDWIEENAICPPPPASGGDSCSDKSPFTSWH
ncbi:MAG: DUF559 domain-containing protein [Lewinellaceae bacterium]|nr:DUF559 domain-containing protein [Phaeodactylibacter sp.]MCB9039623.1 DUF559 domain-containing protein [Lewinellaceae bacterium]